MKMERENAGKIERKMGRKKNLCASVAERERER